jgi:hypothetical protein
MGRMTTWHGESKVSTFMSRLPPTPWSCGWVEGGLPICGRLCFAPWSAPFRDHCNLRANRRTDHPFKADQARNVWPSQVRFASLACHACRMNLPADFRLSEDFRPGSFLSFLASAKVQASPLYSLLLTGDTFYFERPPLDAYLLLLWLLEQCGLSGIGHPRSRRLRPIQAWSEEYL